MEVIKPKVRTLASGKKLITKEMSGKEGKLLPLHLSNLESVIYNVPLNLYHKLS